MSFKGVRKRRGAFTGVRGVDEVALKAPISSLQYHSGYTDRISIISHGFMSILLSDSLNV